MKELEQKAIHCKLYCQQWGISQGLWEDLSYKIGCREKKQDIETQARRFLHNSG